jgi:hypothetical protein
MMRTITTRLSDGVPLAVMCRDAGYPAVSSFYDHAKKVSDFALAIARAREEGYDAIAAKLRETARGKGESSGDVQRDKLIIDTDLKLLSKWDPKRYGEKIDVNATHTGEIRIIVGGDAK